MYWTIDFYPEKKEIEFIEHILTFCWHLMGYVVTTETAIKQHIINFSGNLKIKTINETMKL